MVKKPTVQIRDTKIEDLIHVQDWLFDPEVLKGFPMIDKREVEDAIRYWHQYVEKKMSLTAMYKKKLAGCANLYIQSIEKLKHQSLFVVIVGKSFRGRGIGTVLIKALERLAKKQFHIELLHLEVYENNPATRLYERLGFKRYGSHPRYLKEADGTYYDKILMQKSL